MFRGLSPLALDGKGRLAIPTKYREELSQRCGGRLIVTLDPHAGCLLLYPFPDWEPIERKLNALPSFNAASRRLARILVGTASDLEMDSAGRVLLPAPLREQARLDKDIVLVGQGNKFEIWGAADWQNQIDGANEIPALLDAAARNGEIPDELKDFSL
jgi:MraZ protein